MGLIDDSAVGSISEMRWKEGRTGGEGGGGRVVKNKEWEGKQEMKLEEDIGKALVQHGIQEAERLATGSLE